MLLVFVSRIIFRWLSRLCAHSAPYTVCVFGGTRKIAKKQNNKYVLDVFKFSLLLSITFKSSNPTSSNIQQYAFIVLFQFWMFEMRDRCFSQRFECFFSVFFSTVFTLKCFFGCGLFFWNHLHLHFNILHHFIFCWLRLSVRVNSAHGIKIKSIQGLYLKVCVRRFFIFPFCIRFSCISLFLPGFLVRNRVFVINLEYANRERQYVAL